MREGKGLDPETVALIVKTARETAERGGAGISGKDAARGATLGVAAYLDQQARMPSTQIGMTFDQFSGYRHSD